MAFQEVHSWTLGGLIGAFVDLVLAYFLLCGSAIGFFASKFLRIFGLYLPCPCKGVFGYKNSNFCLHEMLFDWPLRKIGSVQVMALKRFPCDHSCSSCSVQENRMKMLELALKEEKAAYATAVNEAMTMISRLQEKKASIELELEEKKADYAALSIEFEKERDAAATAVDETMAMISRLQEKKSSIEIETRQFRRMMEERVAYDEEKINILEKELEDYRQMNL